MSTIQKVTDDNVLQASNLLKEGNLVSFPTETVYGLGANALDSMAVQKIFTTKNRPATNPLIVHLPTPKDGLSYSNLNDWEFELYQAITSEFCPGPLTVIVPSNGKVSSLVTAGNGMVGLRFPSHQIAQKLLRVCGLPICAPSANKHTHVSPTSAKHVYSDFQDDNVMILDGGDLTLGKGNKGIESTIVRLNYKDKTVEILREGSITFADLKKINWNSFDATLKENKKTTADQREKQIAPGQFLHHYSPWKPTYLVASDKNFDLKKIGILTWGEVKGDKMYTLSLTKDITQAQLHLYKILREMETDPLIEIIGIDDALLKLPVIGDRIFRACQGKYISAKIMI